MQLEIYDCMELKFIVDYIPLLFKPVNGSLVNNIAKPISNRSSVTLTPQTECKQNTCLWSSSLVCASSEGSVECSAHDCR